jgi:protein-disulfide isomerase
MPRQKLLVLALTATAVFLTSTAGAAEIPWNKVIGADSAKLTAEQKTRVTGSLNKLSNTHGCKGTLALCMAKDDLTARRHAGYVVRMVRKNKTDEFIKKGIALRKESTHTDEVFDVALADHPHLGDAKAKVVVVEFACFQCPFCAHLAPQLKTLEKRFKGKVAHYYKFFPVRSHPRGVAAALAGLAAFRQGKFWQMYDLMFNNRANLDDNDLLAYAKKAGLDVAKFQADLKDSSLMRAVEKDKLEGMRFGVEGTPTFFVNGKLYKGTAEFEEIIDRVGEELDIVEGRIK